MARCIGRSGRKREVIVFMVKGMLNKQAAAKLGVSEITVKVHRHNIMQKMKVRGLPDLVRMMEKVNGEGEHRLVTATLAVPRVDRAP